MKRVYDEFQIDLPSYIGSYNRIPYNIIEFWYKSCFLQDLKVNNIDIRYNDDTYLYYGKYHNISNSINKNKKSWINGGQIRCSFANDAYSKNVIKKLKDNLNHGINKTKYDAVLHSQYDQGRSLILTNIGTSSSNIVESKEDGTVAITFWFLGLQH